MPQRKFRMFLSSKNTQTTAYHRFHATRQTNPNFQMNAGCCGNRNPLKGWRKEKTCCLNCCSRTQRVDGSWGQGQGQGQGTPGQVFTQDQNGTSVTGTLIEADATGGIFQMADCHSAFSANKLVGPNPVSLTPTTVDVPIDSNVPCNPLLGGGSNSLGYQMVLKNVQSCCKPSQLKMIQNRARSSDAQTAANGGKPYSVSGKIDRKYNYNYRQYLKKRCMIADYDNRSGGRAKTAHGYSIENTEWWTADCCTTDCGGAAHSPTLTYKRNNNNFYREGAVTNDLYIANKKVFANPCCFGTTQPKQTSAPNPPIQTVNPNVTRTGVIHNFIPIKGGQTIPQ